MRHKYEFFWDGDRNYSLDTQGNIYMYVCVCYIKIFIKYSYRFLSIIYWYIEWIFKQYKI